MNEKNIIKVRESTLRKIKEIDEENIIQLENDIKSGTDFYEQSGTLIVWRESRKLLVVRETIMETTATEGFTFIYKTSIAVDNTEETLIQITSKFKDENLILIKEIYAIYKYWFVIDWPFWKIDQYITKLHKKYWNRRIENRRINRKKTYNEKKCVRRNKYNFKRLIKN